MRVRRHPRAFSSIAVEEQRQTASQALFKYCGALLWWLPLERLGLLRTDMHMHFPYFPPGSEEQGNLTHSLSLCQQLKLQPDTHLHILNTATSYDCSCSARLPLPCSLIYKDDIAIQQCASPLIVLLQSNSKLIVCQSSVDLPAISIIKANTVPPPLSQEPVFHSQEENDR